MQQFGNRATFSGSFAIRNGASVLFGDMARRLMETTAFAGEPRRETIGQTAPMIEERRRRLSTMTLKVGDALDPVAAATRTCRRPNCGLCGRGSPAGAAPSRF